MNRLNVMTDMLAKGDELKPQYAGFNFDALDATQHAALRRLTWFPKYRHRVLWFFEETKMTSHMKLMYIEQHSMKLGDRVFYDIESSRQGYVYACECIPTAGVIIGSLFFIRYAYTAPIQSRLYVEAVKSLFYGCCVAGIWPMYAKVRYLEKVSNAYNMLKAKFEKYPELNKPDSDDVQKNFGQNIWADSMIENEEDAHFEQTISVLDGTAEDERKAFWAEKMQNL
jgi:hypothetical protein